MNAVLMMAALLGASTAHADLAPWLGTQRAVVVLVEWADQPHEVVAAQAQSAFFEEGAPSLRQFFLESSGGKFDFSGHVFNWNRSQLNWDPSRACDPGWIVDEAWNLFQRAIEITQFDSDKNGKIDHLFVIHSGKLPQDQIAPDCMFTNFAHADNTVVLQSAGLGSVGAGIPIGAYLHQAGLGLFGLPELSPDADHGSYGPGIWSGMGLGQWGNNAQIGRDDVYSAPSHFDPASKVRIGWSIPNVVSASQTAVTLRPVETSGDVVAIPIGDGDNYYLEYRSQQGLSAGAPGQGLLLWRNFELIQADGRGDLGHGGDLGAWPYPPTSENLGDDGDPFPGSMNVTEFSDPATGLRLSNISQTDDAVTFDVEVPASSAMTPFAPSRIYAR